MVRGYLASTRNLGDHAAFPVHDLVERGNPFASRRNRVAHLPVLEPDARLFAARPGELEHGRRAAHALQLHDVGDVQIAQLALELRALALAAGLQKRLDERDEIAVRKRLFEKVNRAQSGRAFALRGRWTAVRTMARAFGWLVRRS